MRRLRNIAMHDYQETVTTRQTHGQTDTGQSDPYVPLCFAGDTKTLHQKCIPDRQCQTEKSSTRLPDGFSCPGYKEYISDNLHVKDKCHKKENYALKIKKIQSNLP